MNIKAFRSTLSNNSFTLPIAILYVTEGCNLQCIMCSYRDPRTDELSLSEIQSLAQSLHNYGLRHIVFSGGEPLLRKDFPQISQAFTSLEVKQTLLTNGLLLNKRYNEIKDSFSEIIISIDGPDAVTHNSIRGIDAFSQIVKGIETVLATSPKQNISIRTVLQNKNYRRLADIIQFAKSVGVSRISFLAADVLSESFGRYDHELVKNKEDIILNEEDIASFRTIIDETSVRFKSDFDSGFISESPEKLHKLASYYSALLGKNEFPQVLCNAPNVSAVIQSNGEILPCFFLPEYGNIRSTPIEETLNSPSIQTTRTQVKNCELERCKTCVCSLYVSPKQALLDGF